MSLTIHLTPDQQARFDERAKQQGQDTEGYALNLILRDLHTTSSMIPAGKPLRPVEPLSENLTLDKMLLGRIGLFEGDGPGYLAQGNQRKVLP